MLVLWFEKTTIFFQALFYGKDRFFSLISHVFFCFFQFLLYESLWTGLCLFLVKGIFLCRKDVMKPILVVRLKKSCIFALANESAAEIAQLVEHNLAKVGVAGSSPVFRSLVCPDGGIGRHEGLKILWPHGCAGSSPASGTERDVLEKDILFLCRLC